MLLNVWKYSFTVTQKGILMLVSNSKTFGNIALELTFAAIKMLATRFLNILYFCLPPFEMPSRHVKKRKVIRITILCVLQLFFSLWLHSLNHLIVIWYLQVRYQCNFPNLWLWDLHSLLCPHDENVYAHRNKED